MARQGVLVEDGADNPSVNDRSSGELHFFVAMAATFAMVPSKSVFMASRTV